MLAGRDADQAVDGGKQSARRPWALRILRALAKGETDPKKTYGNLIVGTHVQQQDFVGYVTESAEDNDGD
jgi:hypothetical protein